MTDLSHLRARAAERSLWRIFAAPTVIALASSVGLISALIGDNIMDAVAWLGLGVPVAVGAWFVFLRKTN